MPENHHRVMLPPEMKLPLRRLLLPRPASSPKEALGALGLSSGSAVNQPCNLGQVPCHLWASRTPLHKGTLP